MNYDTIIVEMLSRIQALEEKVKRLEEGENHVSESEQEIKAKTNMEAIRDYISTIKEQTRSKGETFVILTAREIHGALKLKSRYPMVCNAMKQTMKTNDEVLFSPPSGYSSTLEIKYYL